MGRCFRESCVDQPSKACFFEVEIDRDPAVFAPDLEVFHKISLLSNVGKIGFALNKWRCY